MPFVEEYQVRGAREAQGGAEKCKWAGTDDDL
jgi:hypothetical protein